MTRPDRNYMCNQFCEPDAIPEKCLLNRDRFEVLTADSDRTEYSPETLALANKIAAVCQLVSRQLARVDEFRQ